ncbi:MAG: type II secretion system F family protein [Inquilinus sp.]|nr:type II secretion system F family protein [Inquilinus sp.]
MPRFRYKAVTATGEVVEGEMEGGARADIIARLQSDGGVPIRAEEVVARRPAGQRWRPRLALRRQMNDAELVTLVRELATLMQARLPLDRALTILVEVAESGPRREFMRQVVDRVRAGATLADALAGAGQPMPALVIGMVRSGEAGGHLEAVLTQLSESLEAARELKEYVVSALIYPAFVLVTALAALVLLLVAVLPEFRPLFEQTGADMPASTRAMIGLGEFLREFGAFVGLALAAGFLALRAWLRRPAGRLAWDHAVLKLPLFRDVVIKLETARFSRTLATLLGNGLTLLEALPIAIGTVGNSALRAALGDLAPRLKRGEHLSAALEACPPVPTLAVRMIRVGEEGDQFEPMLHKVGAIYEDEVKRTVQRLLALLVPSVTLGLGVVVALIVGSMMSAILGAYDLPI